MILTDTIFETDAFGVPSKSQNPTDLNQVGSASTQWHLSNGHTLIGCASDALCWATMATLSLDIVHKTKSCFPL